MITECITCKKKFKVEPNRIRRGFGKYCSRKCYKPSLEAIQKIKDARKNQILTEEHKNRIREAIRRKWQNGEIIGMKGKCHSKETKQKLKLLNKGKILSPEFISKISSFKKGHLVSKKMRDKISKSNKGRIGTFLGKHHSEETRKKLSILQIGKKFSLETRQKMKESARRGITHHNWKGGISFLRNFNNNYEWDIIRKQIYARDNWTCQICSRKCHKKGEIQCHHIVPYRITKNNDFQNLITLCNSCHYKEEQKYYKSLKNE